jgi:hypothetical protein
LTRGVSKNGTRGRRVRSLGAMQILRHLVPVQNLGSMTPVPRDSPGGSMINRRRQSRTRVSRDRVAHLDISQRGSQKPLLLADDLYSFSQHARPLIEKLLYIIDQYSHGLLQTIVAPIGKTYFSLGFEKSILPIGRFG